jgi:hypothetical protein
MRRELTFTPIADGGQSVSRSIHTYGASRLFACVVYSKMTRDEDITVEDNL